MSLLQSIIQFKVGQKSSTAQRPNALQPCAVGAPMPSVAKRDGGVPQQFHRTLPLLWRTGGGGDCAAEVPLPTSHP